MAKATSEVTFSSPSKGEWTVRLVCGLMLCAFTTAWSQSASPLAPEPSKPQSTTATATDEAEETVAPDTRQQSLVKFKATNQQIREHALNMPMNAYADSTTSPGLRLNRMWVGENHTLLEIEGLPVPGRAASAVFRQETLTLQHANGQAQIQSFEGASQLKDRRGGTAIVVKPGEKLLALFGPVDDARPMQLQHTGPDGRPYIYFENIDPRFRERYTASAKAALASAATPEQMKDFLVEFAANDPDGKAREVFLKLITAMRAQNSFEGFYNVYLLMQDPEDARKASQLARTDEHRAKLEHMAVATLADKNRLFDFDLRLNATSTTSREGRCLMFCNYNFTASRPLAGQLTVQMQPNSPIKLKQASYRVMFTAQIEMPRRKIRESRWKGNYDGPDNVSYAQEFSATVSPPNYSASLPVPLGNLVVAFFERGSAGGYESTYATSNASVQLKLKSVELLK